MNNLNTILIEGNLTREPRSSEYASDYEMCRFSIANNRYYLKKSGEWQTETSYFIVEVYGAAAKACMKYLHKGRGVRVVGRLKMRRWKQDKEPHEMVTIIAEHIEFQPEREKAKASVSDDASQPNSVPSGEGQTIAQPANASHASDVPPNAAQDFGPQANAFQSNPSPEIDVPQDAVPEDFECTAEIGDTSYAGFEDDEKQDPFCVQSPNADEDSCEGGAPGF